DGIADCRWKIADCKTRPSCIGALFAFAQSGEDSQLKRYGSLESEPSRIKLAKCCRCFFEHSKIDIALDGLQTPKRLHVLGAKMSKDNPTHNSSAAFDEMERAVLHH